MLYRRLPDVALNIMLTDKLYPAQGISNKTDRDSYLPLFLYSAAGTADQ